MSYEPLMPPSRGVVPAYHEASYEEQENPFLYKKPKPGIFQMVSPVAPIKTQVHAAEIAAASSEYVVHQLDDLVDESKEIASDLVQDAGDLVQEAGHLIEQGITGTAHLLSVGLWDFIKGLGPWVTIGGIILGIVILTIVIKVVL